MTRKTVTLTRLHWKNIPSGAGWRDWAKHGGGMRDCTEKPSTRRPNATLPQRIKILLTFAVVNAVKLKNISFTQFFDLSKLKHWILHWYHSWLVILGECVISVMHDTWKVVRASLIVHLLGFVAVEIMFLSYMDQFILFISIVSNSK